MAIVPFFPRFIAKMKPYFPVGIVIVKSSEEPFTLTLSHFNKEKVNGRKNGKREDV